MKAIKNCKITKPSENKLENKRRYSTPNKGVKKDKKQLDGEKTIFHRSFKNVNSDIVESWNKSDKSQKNINKKNKKNYKKNMEIKLKFII